LLAHVFAYTTVVELEPFVVSTTEELLEKMTRFATDNKPFNLRRYINYFTIDLFSRLVFSRSQGCIERGDDLLIAESPEGQTYQAHFMKSLHNSARINTVLGFEPKLLHITRPFFGWWHPWKKAGKDYNNIIYHMVMQRARESFGKNDIFSRFIKNNKGEKLNLAQGEILSEASVLMNAGTDTTSAAMTNVIYLLCKNPGAFRKLQQELDTALGDASIPKYEQVANLPYLRAVIEETLRLRPSIAIGLPREVPKGGREIAGRWVEEGVTVSVPQYSLFRDPQIFEDADTFKPERWIDGDKAFMTQAFLPFGTGPRACIGRNISYFEMLLVITALLKTFDFELADPKYELRVLERFNANPDELFVNLKTRTR
jgi:benzoate 4-monooxygenase